MIVLLGKSGSGKDTIANKLINHFGYRKIITWTTRPMRPGEVQDVTYHFTDEETFREKIDEGFFAEWKKYDSVFGTWYYGTKLMDITSFIDDNKILIIEPKRYKDIKNILGYNVLTVYLNCKEDVLLERLRKRGDDIKEVKRRLRHDKKDFRGLKRKVDVVIPSDTRTIWHWAKLINEMHKVKKEGK